MKKLFFILIVYFLWQNILFAQNWSHEVIDLFYTYNNQDTLSGTSYDTSATKQLLYNDSVAVSLVFSFKSQSIVDSNWVDVYVLTSADNSTWDTNQTAYISFPAIRENSASTRVISFKINPGMKFIKFVVYNYDASSIYIRAWITILWSKG